jgi:hypothetical protein
MGRVLSIRARVGDCEVQVSCDIPDGYSPDVADDLSARASKLMRTLVHISRIEGAPTVDTHPGEVRPGA